MLTSNFLFLHNIRLQLAAVAILFVIIIDYVRNPHLKLMSTVCFRIMLICAGVNLLFDIGTVYTVTHPETVPEIVNRIMHQFFMAGIIMVLFFIYLYVKIISRRQKRFKTKEWVIACIPLAVSAVVILFGKLYYVHTEYASYSMGPMVYMVYICAVFYLAAAFAVFFGKQSAFTKYQRISIQTGMCIWICGLIIQMFIPKILLSGIALSLLVLCVYFSFENQRENFDSETGAFNKSAFDRQFSEYYERLRPIELVSVFVENYERINSLCGRAACTDAMKIVKNVMSEVCAAAVFHSRSSVMSVFMMDVGADETAERIIKALENAQVCGVKLSCRVMLMDLRKYTSSAEEVYELIGFMRGCACGGSVQRLDDETAAKKHRRDSIARLVADAIDNDGFEMVYQPIFNTQTNTYKSAEALIRLKSTQELGFVSPEEFIPIAEEQGLIIEIGDKVVDMVAEFAEKEQLDKSSLEYIEVNLSGIQACSPNINERLVSILQRHGVSPHFINLEITETAALDNGNVFDNNIKALRSSGFSFSMDDFGTGYSNIAKMNQMKYNLVKIDKSLLWDAFKENSDRAESLLASVINMLKSIGAEIVAEGVETKEMADYLTEKGVEYLQGYYFSRPVKKSEFLELVRK